MPTAKEGLKNCSSERTSAETLIEDGAAQLCRQPDREFLPQDSVFPDFHWHLSYALSNLRRNHVRISERGRNFEPMQILRRTPVANLAEAKNVFDHPEHVLHLGGVYGTCKLVRFDVHNFERASWIPSLAKRAKTDGSSLVRPEFKLH